MFALPTYPAIFWPIAILALLILSIGKSGFGGGAGLLATPLIALTIPVTDAAALLLPLLIIMDMFSLYHYFGIFDRRTVRVLLPGAVVGIGLGWLFFTQFSENERALRIGIGLLSLAFVLFQMSRALIMGKLEGIRLPDPIGTFIGGVAGFTSTLVHAGGPPVNVYVLPQKLSRTLYVGTTVMVFTLINLLKLVPYTALGLLHIGNLTTIILLAPVCVLGVRLGIYLNGRVNESWFTWIVYTLLLLTGIQLVLGRSLISFVL